MTSNAPPTPAATETLSQQTQQNPKKTTNSNKTTSKEIKITAMALGSTVRRSQAAHSSSGPNGEEPEPARTLCSDEIHVPNGDSYAGSLLHNLPHGTGTYFWSDGCMYHGDWVRGICSGTGKFFWPSGSTFHGRVRHGFMHGYGTFTAHNGDKYTGFWSMNLKHGRGRKAYANGDFYEGSWRCGSQHGHGRYVWSNGNQYIGEWRNGVISGRGKLVWANGNCYEGFWEDGLPKGHGIFTWADGSCYVGNWSKNPNEKNGVYYPSNGRPHRAGLGWDQDEVFFVDLGDCKVDCGVKGSNFQDRLRLDADFRSKSVVCRSSRVADSSRGRGKKGGSGDGASVRRSGFERICIWESDGDITCDIVPCRPVSVPATPMSGWGGDRLGVGGGGGMLQQRLVVGREVKRQGEVICEGHKCYELMLNLQLGIRHSVGRSVPATCQDLLPPAFDPKEKVWTRFPPEGTKRTPSHQSNEFKWKDYCPLAFRCLRQIFKIDAIEYMLSLCCNKAFRELMSPGKSGSLFYLTHDDRYMIKTVKKSEVKVLLRMLPSYYNHVRAYENTLLTKFFGLHCIKSTGPNQKKVRFVIMGNIFFSDYTIHRRFDLKGSSHGRTIKPEVEIDETTTLKDLDLNFLFRLQSTWFEELRKQIDRDCEFLEAEGIMDYSLLVGLHFVDKSISRDSLLSDSKHQRSSCRAMPYVRITGSGETHKSGKGTGCLSTVEVRDMDPNRRSCVRLGVNMPARVEQTVRISNCDGQLVGKPTGEIYDVILFFGIIDILQDYDISKKLEHAYKSIQHDPTSISAVDPRQYSKRFREFMYKIFIGDS